MEKTVAIFRKSLLPTSNTFILDQAKSLHSWSPILLGFKQLNNGLSLDSIPFHIIGRVEKNSLYRRLTKYRLRNQRPIPELVKALKVMNPALVHAHFGTYAVDIWPSVRKAGLPLVVTLHGYDITPSPAWWKQGKGGASRQQYPQQLRELAENDQVHFIAVSHFIKQCAVSYGVPDRKITVAYTGIDTEKFNRITPAPAKRANIVLFVGRMVEIKQPELLINAFALAKKQVPDARLIMVGDGPLLPDLKEIVASRNYKDIDLLGKKDSHEIIELLQQARTLCLPSRTEGLGQVLLEAQACGVPVISSSAGGMPEALSDGVTGYLFEPGNQEALSHAIIGLLTSPDSAFTSDACRNFVVNKFDIRKTTQEIEKVYAKMASSMTTMHTDP